MSNANCCEPGQRKTQLDNEFFELSNQIEVLEHVLKQLESSFSKVIMPEQPECKNTVGVGVGPIEILVPAAQNVREMRLRVKYICDKIDGIISRCEA
jgi:hypothetical protein